MKGALDNSGSDSHDDASQNKPDEVGEVFAFDDNDLTHSPGSSRRKIENAELSATGSFRSPPDKTDSGLLPSPSESSSFTDEREETFISQQPAAAPEEFFRSMPLAELASLLEGKAARPLSSGADGWWRRYGRSLSRC